MPEPLPGGMAGELYRAERAVAPAVVVIHEAFGLNDDIRRIAKRFAAEGYTAAAVDLYRGGNWMRCVARELLAMRMRRGRSVTDLDALVAALGDDPAIGPVGVVGFCLGGGFAMLLGTRGGVGAVGAFYGDPPSRDALAKICPVVGGFGARDRIYGRKGHQLKRDLDELGIANDVKVYDNAGHSFMSDAGHRVLATMARPIMRVEYNEAAAEDSWKRMLAFFGEHLAA